MTTAPRTPRRAVFLDRDGVLNEAVVRDGLPFPPRSSDELVVFPGVAEACQGLREHGYVLVVVTNQPDVARGLQSASGVAAINALLRQSINVDAVYVCHHDNDDGCRCRKPKPGMLRAAARDLNLDLNQSFMVGDRWSDIAAGQGAGCRTVYIDFGYQEQGALSPDHVVSNPVEALEWILMTAPLEEGGSVRSTSLRHQDLRRRG
jgi:D-glycero-D-manno-heptose 1,7-bisphosphate phosphatase